MADTIADVVVQLQADMSDALSEFKSMSAEIKKLEGEFQQAANLSGVFKQAIDALTDTQQALVAEMAKSADALAELASGQEKAGDSATHAREEQESLLRNAAEFATVVTGVSLTVEALVEKMREWASEALHVAVETQRIEESIRFLTGGEQAAEGFTAAVRQLAMQLGASYEQLERAGQKMLAMGYATQQTAAMLHTAIGVSRAFGTELTGVMATFEHFATSGNLRALRPFGVDAEKLIPTLKQMGISVDDVNKSLKSLTTETRMDVLFNHFHNLQGLSKDTADDMQSNIDRMNTAWHFAMLEMGNAFGPFVTKVAEGMTILAYRFQGFQAAVHEVAQYVVEDWQLMTAMTSKEIAEHWKNLGKIHEQGVKDQEKIDAQQERDLGRLKTLLADAYKPGPPKYAPPTGGEAAKTAEDAYKLQAEAIDATAKHQLALINLEKIALDIEKARGLSSEEYHAKMITLIDKERDAEIAATNAKLAALRATPGMDPAKRAQAEQELIDKRQQQQDKASEQLAKENEKYAKQSIDTERYVVGEHVKMHEQASLGILAAEKTRIEEQQKLGNLTVDQTASQLHANNAEVLAAKEETIAQQMQLEIKNGEDVGKARVTAQAKLLAAVVAFAKEEENVDKNLADKKKAIAQDIAKAAEEAQDAIDAHTRSGVEEQRQLAEIDYNRHRLTLAQRFALDLNYDQQEARLARNRITRAIALLDAEHANDADYASKREKLIGELQAVEDAAASKEKVRMAEYVSSLMQGITTVEQLKTAVADAGDAYTKLLNAGMTTDFELIQSAKRLLEAQIQLAQATLGMSEAEKIALDAHTDSLSSLEIQLSNLNRQQEYQKDQAMAMANVYNDLMDTWDQMFGKFGSGMAEAIAQGKGFGQVMHNVLTQIEQELLSKLLTTFLNVLRDIIGKLVAAGLAKILIGLAGGATGGGAGGAAAGAATAAPGIAAQTANTTATVANTAAIVADTGSLVALIASNEMMFAMQDVLMGFIVSLTAAIDANTVALYVTGFIPGMQSGGTVARTGVAVIHAGETVASNNILQGIGATLSSGNVVNNAPPTVSFDGAVFHGVPDQRYVNSIMDTAVRSLRMASRSWAFNPQGK
jgi:hypothetical protein